MDFKFTRRDFLKGTATSAVSITAASLTGCRPKIIPTTPAANPADNEASNVSGLNKFAIPPVKVADMAKAYITTL
jgi:hypothetical protein